VSVLLQPGRSKPDDDVRTAVETAGTAMVFTGRRHLRH
jgi:AICAR transformylase/IMP cyclohydrolase PurH